MWQLILTLALTPSGGVAISTVPGFTSRDACQAAASTWLAEVNIVKRDDNGVTWARPRIASAVCAAQAAK